MLLLNIKSESTEVDLVWITDFLDISYAFGMDVFLSTTWESVYKGEVTLLYSSCRNLEIFLRSVRHVVFRIWSRIVVLVSIYSEH